MTNEQRYLEQGIVAGAVANEAIADAIATKAAEMLKQSLNQNFEVLLEAKLAQVINETLSLHADKTKRFAQEFLAQSKIQMATTVIETQQQNQLPTIRTMSFEDLQSFDPSLDEEIKRLADESATMTIQLSEESCVGF